MDRRSIIFVFALTLALFGTRAFFDSFYENKAPQEAQKQPGESPSSSESKKKDTASFDATVAAPEQYYILQNNYTQLVFSNRGGALVEINLPFQSESDPKSVVLPIEFDRDIEEMDPQNAQFPLRPAINASRQMQTPAIGGYYPLLRRDLLPSKDNKRSFSLPPRLYALNIVSEYPEVAELTYEVKQFSDSEIIFEARQPHRRITKKFSLPKESDAVPYGFLLEIKIEGDSRGLWLTSGVPEVELMSGGSEPTIKYRVSKGNSYEVIKADLPSQVFTLTSSSPDWVCNSNGFFGLILDPTKGNEAGFKIERVDGNKDPSRLTLIDQEYDRFPAEDMPGFEVLLPIKPAAGQMEVRVFAGPFAESILKTVDAHFLEKGDKISDYLSCQTFHGWFAFISEPFAKFLFFIMKLCYAVTHSWVFSIVFVTFILRLILYPLNTWSLRSMKGMQEVAPQVKAIQERYKKEPQKAQMEIMTLYRERGVNPLSGCLPLLLQLPFLIGMFDLLKSTFELRGASFIPGWIDNLTAPDVLFSWTTPLPIIGNQLHLLPIILGAIMYIQQNVMSSLPKDPSTWTDQQRQQRMMGNIMTVVMTFLFYNFPSGLNIYWISSMLLGIAQQWWVNRASTKAKQNPIVEIVSAPTHKQKKHKFDR